MSLNIVSYFFIFLALLVCTLKYSLLKRSNQKYFIYYLLFVFVNEILQIFTAEYLNISTLFNINLYDIVTYLFFVIWYFRVLKNKIIVKVLGFIYLMFLIISLVTENIFNEFLEINTYAGTVLVLILVIKFYSELLIKNETINFLKEPKFWISTGLLIFNVGYLPTLFLLNLNYYEIINVDLIMTVLNIFLYSCLIKGFLCYQKKIN